MIEKIVIINSNIIEGIKAVYFIFYKKTSHAQKAQNTKHKTQINNFHSDVFYTHKKHKKHKT